MELDKNKNFQMVNLSEDDALSFTSGMYKAGNLIQSLGSLFLSAIASTLHEKLKSQGIDINSGTYHANSKNVSHTKWFREGIDCEVLKPNSPGWEKGKVRLKVVLEFCPDEPENEEIENPDQDSLDDIRKTL